MTINLDELSRRTLLKLSGVTAAALAFPSFATVAGDEKKLVVFTWETYHLDPWVREWSESNGIEVQTILTGSTDEMYARIASGAVQPDIILADVGALKRYISNKMVAPLDINRVPNARLVSKSLNYEARNSVNGALYGLPYNWGVQPLMYSNAALGDGVAMDNWDVLWNKRFAGKVSLFDDGYATIPMVAAKVGAKDVYNLSESEFSAVAEALRALRPQVVSIARGPSDQAAAFASGDALVGYCMFVNSVFELNARGKQQFGYAFPKNGALGWIDNMAITPRGNKEASYRFINDMLSAKWQSRFITSASTNGVLTLAEAREAGVTEATLSQTTIPAQDTPGFTSNLLAFDAPEDIDRRVQMWNDFKAGTL